eukprot:TRINITY_DN19996_c0_g1_i1.p1 TRINITY_DN19996_c0_g1~~TRINITY_DN19996_c0_g1_i1.p1  ORF type:complete len:564 (+),score=110.38 TRINITY_DN19996_c0_g1_i1:307-1998(+)
MKTILSAVPTYVDEVDDNSGSFIVEDDDSDDPEHDMSDGWYHRAHADDAIAGAVRTQWVWNDCWTAWSMPFTGREGLADIKKRLNGILESTSPTIERIKKSRKKSDNTLEEEIHQALECIPECEAESEKFHSQVTQEYSESSPEPRDCCCVLSSQYVKGCGGEVTHRVECRSIKVNLLKGGTFGLTFQGLLLTATTNEDALLFVGYRVQSINNTPVYSWQQLQATLRAHKKKRSSKGILLTFHPKYMQTAEVQSVGSQVPLYKHSVFDSSWKYIPPMSVFGPGLMLENIARSKSSSIFQCVLLQTNKKRVKRTRYAASFQRSHLRYIYPTAFFDFQKGDPGSHNPSGHLFAIHSAVREFIETHKRDEQFSLFNRPVHPGLDNIPSYFGIIQRPMDIGTIATLLDNGLYDSEEQVMDDINIVWSNCKEFNPKGDSVYNYAVVLEASFKTIYTKYQNQLEFSASDTESEEAALVGTNSAASDLIELFVNTPQYSPLFLEVCRELASVKDAARWAVQRPRKTPVEDDDEDEDVDVVFKINPHNITRDIVDRITVILLEDGSELGDE